MRTIKAKLVAQLSPYSVLTPDDFETMSDEELAASFYYHARRLNEEYTVVGEAEVTVTLLGKEKLIESKVSSLKDELRKTQADAEVKCAKLREQINSLLCITYQAE